MTHNRKHAEILIVWEPVPESNQEALTQAFAMIFRKRSSPNREFRQDECVPLTSSDKKLQCERKADR